MCAAQPLEQSLDSPSLFYPPLSTHAHARSSFCVSLCLTLPWSVCLSYPFWHVPSCWLTLFHPFFFLLHQNDGKELTTLQRRVHVEVTQLPRQHALAPIVSLASFSHSPSLPRLLGRRSADSLCPDLCHFSNRNPYQKGVVSMLLPLALPLVLLENRIVLWQPLRRHRARWQPLHISNHRKRDVTLLLLCCSLLTHSSRFSLSFSSLSLSLACSPCAYGRLGVSTVVSLFVQL